LRFYPFAIVRLSHLSESNQRPTDYKSVALPAELKWHFSLIYQGISPIKILQ
jgi:hypothetical protein